MRRTTTAVCSAAPLMLTACGSQAAVRPVATPASAVTLCRYAAEKDADGSPLLHFRSGEKLGRAASAALVSALEASGPEKPCTVEHTTVVGLFTEQNGWALIETDGCHRVHGADARSWRQASPGLLARLG